MLANQRFSLTAQTTFGGEVIATHGAVIEADASTVQFMFRQVNEAACEEHRDIVRRDRAEFEDFAYDLKNCIQNMMEEPVDEPGEDA